VNPVELDSIFPGLRSEVFGDIRVCWFSAKGPQKYLFFGPHAVVRMHEGLPADLCPELQHLPGNTHGWYGGWCLLDDMRLELWETETVLLSNRVEPRLAEAFGNGELPVSELRQALAAHGFPEHNIDWMLRWGSELTQSPENWGDYRRYQLRGFSPEYTVPVTWRETIAQCAGRIVWDEGLARLRGLENPALYRIVMSAG
jgi:hypothetical protein